NKLSMEVVAGYEVDEMEAAIAIRLSPDYPLSGVEVLSIRRVAVDERKWKSWLLTTQAVITFSVRATTIPFSRLSMLLPGLPLTFRPWQNGNIIDGLSVFRRNIIGALKGQSECAICFSLVSTDKKMPDKRCQTCKHLFHKSCLYKWFNTSSQNSCP